MNIKEMVYEHCNEVDFSIKKYTLQQYFEDTEILIRPSDFRRLNRIVNAYTYLQNAQSQEAKFCLQEILSVCSIGLGVHIDIRERDILLSLTKAFATKSTDVKAKCLRDSVYDLNLFGDKCSDAAVFIKNTCLVLEGHK